MRPRVTPRVSWEGGLNGLEFSARSPTGWRIPSVDMGQLPFVSPAGSCHSLGHLRTGPQTPGSSLFVAFNSLSNVVHAKGHISVPLHACASWAQTPGTSSALRGPQVPAFTLHALSVWAELGPWLMMLPGLLWLQCNSMGRYWFILKPTRPADVQGAHFLHSWK